MAQLSLYMTDDALQSLKADAEAMHESLSKYANRILAERNTAASRWPDGYWDLYGCIADDDSFARPAQPNWSDDAPRASL